MKKLSWMVALLIALSMALVGCGAEPDLSQPSGTKILKLSDIIGATDPYDEITELPEGIKKQGPITLTVTDSGKGIIVSGRGEDYHGIEIDLKNLIDPNGDYEVEFGGFTAVGNAVKIGQPDKPYTDLLELKTVTADEPVVDKKDLAPVFGAKGQMVMRISANESPYVNGGFKGDFTITKFVITVK